MEGLITLEDAERQALRAGHKQPGIDAVDRTFGAGVVLLMFQKFRRWTRSVRILKNCFFTAHAARLEKVPELEEERNKTHLYQNAQIRCAQGDALLQRTTNASG